MTDTLDTCPLVAMERRALADRESLRDEKANRGTMLTAWPCVVATMAGTYLIADKQPGRLALGSRKQAVRYSRADAEAVAAAVRERGCEATVLTHAEALDRDIENNEELLRVIRTI